MKRKAHAHNLKLDKDALARFNDDVAYKELLQLSQRLEILEERRRERSLTTTFIALEAIAAILGARREGFASQQVHRCFPVEWGDSTVEIPTVLIAALAQAWLHHKAEGGEKSLGQSFGLEATGTNSRKMLTACRDADRHLRLANAVELEYWAASASEQPISFETAITTVSETLGASHETVKRAHAKYRDHVRNQLIAFGILHV